MVEQVTAWQADDGTVYSTEEMALKRDATVALRKFDFINEGSRYKLVESAEDIVRALRELAIWQSKQPKQSEEGTYA